MRFFNGLEDKLSCERRKNDRVIRSMYTEHTSLTKWSHLWLNDDWPTLCYPWEINTARVSVYHKSGRWVRDLNVRPFWRDRRLIRLVCIQIQELRRSRKWSYLFGSHALQWFSIVRKVRCRGVESSLCCQFFSHRFWIPPTVDCLIRCFKLMAIDDASHSRKLLTLWESSTNMCVGL